MEITTTFTERIKRIFQVAFPLIVQGLVYQLQSLTDKAFLGNVDTRYVSAAGAAQMPYLATMDSLAAVSTGLIIIISKLYGAGKKERISAYVKSMAVYHTFVTAAVFLLWFCFTPVILDFFQIDHEIIGYSITYVRICILYMPLTGIDCALQAMLQGMGETKPIMYAGILKVGLNILISWLLIFGRLGLPALHVAGAAIGTLIANLLSFLFIFIYCVVYKRNTYHLHRFSDGEIQGKLYREIVRLGIPVGLEYLLWNSSNLVLIRFINSFSYQDMAIYTLTFGFQCIIYVIFSGTSKAALSLIGQSIGAGEHKQANCFFYTTILINFVIVGIAAVCFTAFPKQLLRIFSNDHELISQAAFFLVCIGFIMIPQSVNVICGNAIRANDDTRWMLFSQIFGSAFVISVSYFLIKGLHMHMLAIYVTLFLDEALRGTINFFYYQRKYGKNYRSRL